MSVDGEQDQPTSGSPPPGISTVERAALARKYGLLAQWRRRKDREHQDAMAGESRSDHRETGETRPGGEVASDDQKADRAGMRALAREFPGALRELDVLGLPELSRRITCLADPLCREPWMAWIAAYHRLMRAALAIKRATGPRRDHRATPDDEMLARAVTTAGMTIDQSFVRAVVQPPAGRLGVVVLQELAGHFQVPASEISHTLFPPRRPAPYRLSS